MGQPDTPACPEPEPDGHQELPKAMNLAKRRGRRKARRDSLSPPPQRLLQSPAQMHFPRQMHFPHWMHFPGQMHFR